MGNEGGGEDRAKMLMVRLGTETRERYASHFSAIAPDHHTL